MVFCNLKKIKKGYYLSKSHNPYFNRWFSAIKKMTYDDIAEYSHNPYFNRWFSAIQPAIKLYGSNRVTILILIDGFLQYMVKLPLKKLHMESQSLF